MKWKGAISQSQRDKVFKEYGVRWSVLLRLPYWDPPRFTVVDTMHTVLLGHLHRHCSILWKMNPARSDNAGGNLRPSSSNAQGTGFLYKTAMSIAYDIRSAPEKVIRGRNKASLWSFCLESGIMAGGSMEGCSKEELQEKVLDYVSTMQTSQEYILKPI